MSFLRKKRHLSTEPTDWWGSFQKACNELRPEVSQNDYMPRAPSNWLTAKNKEIVRLDTFRSNNANHLNSSPKIKFSTQSPLKINPHGKSGLPTTPKRFQLDQQLKTSSIIGQHKSVKENMQNILLRSSQATEQTQPKLRDRRVGGQ